MTRSEPQPALYDADPFTWTQRQAAALRAVPRPASIDIEHGTEEDAWYGVRRFLDDLGTEDRSGPSCPFTLEKLLA